MEPGPTMLYYTNIEWSLSERPFLVVLQRPNNSSDITTTVVTPMFEATRAAEAIQEAKLPKEISVKVVEWIEHGSPYETAAELLQDASHVFVEPGVRLFVYDGLADILSLQHGVVTTMASRALQTLRMVKSPAEIAIMRCANRATVAAAKQVRHHVKPGMTEADIATLVTKALTTAGLTKTWVLALVDENAAFPHGEPGATKRVTDHSTVLIDSGGELLGYQSDVTRTFSLIMVIVTAIIKPSWMLGILSRMHKRQYYLMLMLDPPVHKLISQQDMLLIKQVMVVTSLIVWDMALVKKCMKNLI